MKKEQGESVGLRVALADFDERRLFIYSRLLKMHCNVKHCVGYQQGEELLKELAAGVDYTAILLGRELLDMEAGAFFDRFYKTPMPWHPHLIFLSENGVQGDVGELLRDTGRCSILESTQLAAICRMIEGAGCDREERVDKLCAQLYREWNLTRSSRNCEHVTRLMRQAVLNPNENDLRKGIVIPVHERYGISVSALESGLARVRDETEEQNTPEWQAMLCRWGVAADRKKKLEPKEFINIMRSEVIRRMAESWKREEVKDEADPG